MTALVLAVGDDVLERLRPLLADPLTATFEECRTPGEAAMLLATGHFDVMLVSAARSDALDALRTMLPVAADRPVVLICDDHDEQILDRALAEGAQDCLFVDGLGPRSLLRALRAAIDRERREAALRIENERLLLAIAGSQEGLWDWDLHRETVHYSLRWKEMLGYGPDEVDATIDGWLDRVHPDDRQGVRDAINAHLGAQRPYLASEHRLRRRDGSFAWVLARGLAVRDAGGAVSRVTGTLADVSDRKRAEEQLLHDAFHDALTGLPNRALFLDHLALSLERVKRNPRALFAVLFLDLDRFKNLNDSLGHASGDLLLVQLATRLQTCLRPGDTVARLGGDEFAVILSDVGTSEDGVRIAERIQALIRQPFLLDGTEVFTTASIGLALGEPSYQRPDHLLRDADTAMYRAKAAGRACCQVFDQEMHASVAASMRMEMDLRRAVDHGRFVMHYQPIVALATGAPVGVEGLVRWVDGDRGLVCPKEFLQVAEESGLIIPIGWWALSEAARQLRAWRDEFAAAGTLYVSVNVSARLFTRTDMVPRLRELLAHTGLPPSCLRIEVHETVLIDHSDIARAVLAELDAMGVRVCIDDFGTGYSSLAFLHRFAYRALKIDGSLIAGVDQRDDQAAIVEAIISMAEIVGLDVIAEGVERGAEAARLRSMRCPHAQGFFFVMPVPAADIREIISAACEIRNDAS